MSKIAALSCAVASRIIPCIMAPSNWTRRFHNTIVETDFCGNAEESRSMSHQQIDLPTGATLDVRFAGQTNAPPVVLLHGFLGTADLHFSQLIAALAPHYYIVAPSLRGY